MNDTPIVKTSAEIVSEIGVRIRTLFQSPECSIRDFGELDYLFFHLYSIYAFALGKQEQFAETRWTMFTESTKRFQTLQSDKESNRPIESVFDAATLLDFWKEVDQRMEFRLVDDEA
jgi:hypothetical protein